MRIWDLPSQKTIFSVQAHSRFVRGLVCDPTGKTFYTCSDDKTIKRFRLAMDISDVYLLFLSDLQHGIRGNDYNPEPLNVWYGKEGFKYSLFLLFTVVPLITAGLTIRSSPAVLF